MLQTLYWNSKGKTMSRIRISKQDYYFKLAIAAAERSHDIHTQVGSVLVSEDGSIIGSGYNGFVRGAPDELLPKTRPEKYVYILHSELNLVLNCAKNGISMKNCIIYATMSPCETCTRMLYQVGIKRVYFINKYRDFDKILNLLDIKIKHEENWIEFEDN